MSVKKTKNNTWSAVIYDDLGRRKEKRFKRKGDAEAFESQNKSRKRENKLVSVKLKIASTTIEQACSDYMLSKPELRNKSRVKYDYIISQFKAFCSGKKINLISDFSSDRATEFFNAIMVNDPKPKTVNGYLALVRSLFRNEVIKGHTVKNPFDHIKNLRVQKKTPDYYSEEELKRFFEQTMKEEYRNAFIGFLNTGMRFEELANLTGDNVDLKSRLIQIHSKGDFKTKTFNSERSIPINNTLLELLKKLKRNSSEYVFPGTDGGKLKERRLLKVCKEIGKSAKITSRVYIHKFRHTFASHLVQKGVAIEAIQKLLGHSSINETMVYACLKPETLHAQVSILDDLMK
jgi:site-specific recombinase XerD